MAEEQLTIKQKAVLKGWEMYYGNASVSADEGFEATAKEAIELVLKKVEDRFTMSHACDCEKWCSCWDDFKKGCLK